MGHKEHIPAGRKKHGHGINGAGALLASVIPEDRWKRTSSRRLPNKSLEVKTITLEVNQLRLTDYTFRATGSNQCGEPWDCEHDANHAYAQLVAGDTYALVHVRTYR
jgi:hypothetical protein